MPRSRPVKRLSDGELAELRTQLIDLLDRGLEVVAHGVGSTVIIHVVSPRPLHERGVARLPSTRQGLGSESAHHKNANATVERADGVVSGTLRALANGREKD
jgi:hypothetical protein